MNRQRNQPPELATIAKGKRERHTFRIPEHLSEIIKDIASEWDTSMANVVSWSLWHTFGRHSDVAAADIATPHRQTHGIHSADTATPRRQTPDVHSDVAAADIATSHWQTHGIQNDALGLEFIIRRFEIAVERFETAVAEIQPSKEKVTGEPKPPNTVLKSPQQVASQSKSPDGEEKTTTSAPETKNTSKSGRGEYLFKGETATVKEHLLKHCAGMTEEDLKSAKEFVNSRAKRAEKGKKREQARAEAIQEKIDAWNQNNS